MYWKNSNFQIRHFIVGKCFTADEAYRVLCELREDRKLAIDEFEAYKLETVEKLNDYSSTLSNSSKVIAESKRLSSQLKHAEECYLQAIKEIQYIEKLIDEIEPHRQFSHLPDAEAFQECQRLEWKLKLENKMQIALKTQGTISPDLLETIQAHPDRVQLLARLNHFIENPKEDIASPSKLLPLLGE